MSNGLGAGFLALTLLAVLGGLALLSVLTAIVSAVFYRRTSHIPMPLRYLLVVICIGVLAVSGFGILVLYDEALSAAWLFAAIVIVPFLAVSGYLTRTTEVGRRDVIATTVMAWSVPFFLGVGVAFGVITGIESVFGLSPVESRQMGVAEIGFAVGGLAILLSMHLISTRLVTAVDPTTATREHI